MIMKPYGVLAAVMLLVAAVVFFPSQHRSLRVVANDPIEDDFVENEGKHAFLPPDPVDGTENVSQPLVTAVVMSYPASDRHHILNKIIMRTVQWPFILEILLVWNGRLEELPPSLQFHSHKIKVLPQSANRVENRWLIARHVRTEAILNMDDDIFVTYTKAYCMYMIWRSAPSALIADTVRAFSMKGNITTYVAASAVQGWKTIAEDVKPGGNTQFKIGYGLALPRCLFLHRDALVDFAAEFTNETAARQKATLNDSLRSIVHELDCDDLALNFATGRRAIRVVAPSQDYRASSGKSAMYKQPGMFQKRLQCIERLNRLYPNRPHWAWSAHCGEKSPSP